MCGVKTCLLLIAFIPIHHFLGHLILLVLWGMVNACSTFTFPIIALIIFPVLSHTVNTCGSLVCICMMSVPSRASSLSATLLFQQGPHLDASQELKSSEIWSGQMHRNRHLLWLQASLLVSQEKTRKASTRCWQSKEEEAPLRKAKAYKSSTL